MDEEERRGRESRRRGVESVKIRYAPERNGMGSRDSPLYGSGRSNLVTEKNLSSTVEETNTSEGRLKGSTREELV